MADEDEHRKCLVIQNESEIDLYLYIYKWWVPFSKFLNPWKIIKPNQGFLYHDKTLFKFKIVAKSVDDEKPKNLLGPEEWNEDKEITITESLECQTKKIAEIENGRQLCLQKIHREEELEPADLYDILGLNMEDVRKMSTEDLKKEIPRASKKQILTWHPDKKSGAKEILLQIYEAKKILMNDERRARYHNEVNYDKGWFSRKRWTAIFRSEVYSEEQKKEFWHRMRMFAASLVFTVGGVALTIGSAKAASPLLVISGRLCGGAIAGAGFQSLGHTTSKQSVLEKCDIKSWGKKLAIGAVGGAVTEGAHVGITAGIVGIGSAALESGAITAGQYVGMGTATGAVGGAVSSLCSDFANVYVDGEKITAGQVIFRAIGRSLVAAGAGALGGLVTKGVINRQASAGTSTLEGDAVEQVPALTVGKRIGRAVALGVSKLVTINGTKAVLGETAKVIQKRLDGPVENQNFGKNVQTESRVNQRSGRQANNENRKQSDDEQPYMIIKYRSRGNWFSKMIVTYYLNGRSVQEEVSGDGKRVSISAGATGIEVKFQVRRLFWGDVMKYDRFKKTWCKPYTPHIFQYEKAVDRTFTIGGPLHWEAVMRVSDEYHKETEEMS